MPLALADDFALIMQGDMAVATVTVIVTDDAAKELGRVPVRAEINANLRADDETRRGMKIDAKDRLRELVWEKAIEAAVPIVMAAEPLGHFEGIAEALKAEEPAASTALTAKVAEVKAAPPPVKEVSPGLLESEGLLEVIP